MSAWTGTAALTRLAFRLDRVRLSVWVLVLGLLPAITAAQYRKLYPTPSALEQVSGVISNPSLVALNGPLFAGGSIGALTAWKLMATELILVALMGILTVVRHSRAEEEAGRLELLGAGVVGRQAPLAASVNTATIANLGIGVIAALGLLAAGQPADGSLLMAVAITATGLVFAGIGAITAQLTESARTASGMAIAALGVAYLLRAVGDTGPTWMSWLSPVGWGMRAEAFAGDRWWVLLAPIALAVLAAGAAFALNGRRDLGFGLMPQRPGPAGTARLTGAFSLAWRLQRGTIISWMVGMAVWGAVLGGAAEGIASAQVDNKQLTDILTRLGGDQALVDAYLAACLSITGLIVAAFAVQSTLRMRAEETSGRLEPLLATRTGRIRWALSHIVLAVGGTAVLLALTGTGAGLAYGSQVHDTAGEAGRLLVAAMVQAPAAWILAGLGVALFGLAPRLSGLAWAALAACLVILEVGEVLGLSQWLLDVSPFAHAPKLPGGGFSSTPVIWLTAIAIGLGGTGLAAFRRRDAA